MNLNLTARKSRSSRFAGPVWLRRAAAAARVTSKSSALLEHSRKQIMLIPVLILAARLFNKIESMLSAAKPTKEGSGSAKMARYQRVKIFEYKEYN